MILHFYLITADHNVILYAIQLLYTHCPRFEDNKIGECIGNGVKTTRIKNQHIELILSLRNKSTQCTCSYSVLLLLFIYR